MFIPHCSPQFNLIELFFAALKVKRRRLKIEGALKLSTEAGKQRIVDAINQIMPVIIVWGKISQYKGVVSILLKKYNKLSFIKNAFLYKDMKI